VRRKLLKSAIRIAAVFAAAYLAVAALVWWQQDRLLYFPSRSYREMPERSGLRHEDAWMTDADGVKIHGWFIPAGTGRGLQEVPREPRATILYFHGNGDNVSTVLFRIGKLHDAGFASLIVDYRGYGESEGKPSENGLYLDADAAWAWLTNTRGIDPGHVVIWGHSLGGGVATEAAVAHHPAALVLESAFTSVPDVGAKVYPWLPVHLLARNVFGNLARVPALTCPVWIGHSRIDEVIPFSHGEALFAAAHAPKTFFELAGGHNEGFDATPGAEDSLDAFLAGNAGISR
jgi:fermentation-respiration switch protein FrsA (DUF1100 family)